MTATQQTSLVWSVTSVMMKNAVIFVCFIYVCHAKATKTMRDCMKPWQDVLLTTETVSNPSTAVQCHPDSNPCPHDAECQFSFKGFQYVCCKDRKDVRAPLCPKYHDTLRTLCGSDSEATCPSGYNCMTSRFHTNTKICCRPNAGLKYTEPETGFLDHFITPEVIPIAPKEEIKIQFEDLKLKSGQMLSSSDFGNLENLPYISGFNGSIEELYTIMLFDISVEKPVELYWFVSNVRYSNGTFDLGCGKKRSERYVIHYHTPREDAAPAGVHVVVLVVFEQIERWTSKRWPKVDDQEFNVKEWIAAADGLINPTPVAGNFFGYRSIYAEKEIELDN